MAAEVAEPPITPDIPLSSEEEPKRSAFGSIERVQINGVTVIRKRSRPGVHSKFLRNEYSVLCRLQHPNIVSPIFRSLLLDFPDEILLPLYDTDLDRYTVDKAPLAQELVHSILQQVAAGLSYLHSEGFVHCDIKPDNILFAIASRTVVIADFGFAAAQTPADAYHLRSSYLDTARASPLWMPPERLNHPRLICPAIDVWSLALVAYFLFSGQEPWTNYRDYDPFTRDLVNDRLVVQLKRPSSCVPFLWETMQRCWTFSFTARPTAHEFGSAVQLVSLILNK